MPTHINVIIMIHGMVTDDHPNQADNYDKFWKAIGGMYYGDDPDFLPMRVNRT